MSRVIRTDAVVCAKKPIRNSQLLATVASQQMFSRQIVEPFIPKETDDASMPFASLRKTHIGRVQVRYKETVAGEPLSRERDRLEFITEIMKPMHTGDQIKWRCWLIVKQGAFQQLEFAQVAWQEHPHQIHTCDFD